MIKGKTVWDSLRITMVLVLICALIAGLVALVYQLTADKIAENLEGEKREAILAIFDAADVAYAPLDNCPDTVEAVYAVQAQGAQLGYCVNLNAAGFGGDINMMVGVGDDGKIIGVTIVSMSETPGLGTKVNNAAYLSQYIGQGAQVSDADMISGATVSSRAVLEGVTAAMAALSEMGLIGGETHE